MKIYEHGSMRSRARACVCVFRYAWIESNELLTRPSMIAIRCSNFTVFLSISCVFIGCCLFQCRNEACFSSDLRIDQSINQSINQSAQWGHRVMASLISCFFILLAKTKYKNNNFNNITLCSARKRSLCFREHSSQPILLMDTLDSSS